MECEVNVLRSKSVFSRSVSFKSKVRINDECVELESKSKKERKEQKQQPV